MLNIYYDLGYEERHYGMDLLAIYDACAEFQIIDILNEVDCKCVVFLLVLVIFFYILRWTCLMS
jgi:hypothetical protein